MLAYFFSYCAKGKMLRTGAFPFPTFKLGNSSAFHHGLTPHLPKKWNTSYVTQDLIFAGDVCSPDFFANNFCGTIQKKGYTSNR